MKLVFDPAKSRRNALERGLPFTAAASFDWTTAWMLEDRRKEYGEPRFRAIGMIGVRLHVLVFTFRHEELRVISLRRANRRERALYEAKGQAEQGR